MSGYNLKKDIIIFCLKIFLTSITNSEYSDEMQLHCLLNYSFRSANAVEQLYTQNNGSSAVIKFGVNLLIFYSSESSVRVHIK